MCAGRVETRGPEWIAMHEICKVEEGSCKRCRFTSDRKYQKNIKWKLNRISKSIQLDHNLHLRWLTAENFKITKQKQDGPLPRKDKFKTQKTIG